MAFATTNIRRSAFGDMKVTAGDWTGSIGDASGTFVVEGGRVYFVSFLTNDTTGPFQFVPVTVSEGTTGTSTVTIHNREAVTTGRFIIIHA